MRKKALLAEASSLFQGPRVFLEEGSWRIDPPMNERCYIELIIIQQNETKAFINGTGLIVEGPATVSARVISPNVYGVHLDAKQVS